MKFKSILLAILFIALIVPSGLSAYAESEEDLTEAESQDIEAANAEGIKVEGHLAERKKKKGKKLSNNEPTGRGDIITKGADDDVVLELDE